MFHISDVYEPSSIRTPLYTPDIGLQAVPHPNGPLMREELSEVCRGLAGDDGTNMRNIVSFIGLSSDKTNGRSASYAVHAFWTVGQVCMRTEYV